MKKEAEVLIVFAVAILMVASSVSADNITFTSSGTIGAGETYDTVYVENDGTVVDMTGGQIANLYLSDESIFHFSGGQISGTTPNVSIESTSSFNMTNGTSDLFGFYLFSAGCTANISGGIFSAEYTKIYPEAMLILDNANVYFDSFEVMDDGQVDIFGGNIEITSAHIAYGYYIGDNYMDVGATINIYGYDFSYNSTTEILSGYLQDDNYFQIGGIDEFEYTSFNFIPEPATLLLLCVGGLLIRKRG